MSEDITSFQIGFELSAKAQDALQSLIDAITTDVVSQSETVTIDELYEFKDRGALLMLELLTMHFKDDSPLQRIVNLLSQLEACRRACEAVQNGCASGLISNESS